MSDDESVSESYLDAIETEPRHHLDRDAWDRLERVLSVAAELPFYRKRFAEEGVDLRAVDDLNAFSAKLPTFRKADLIAEFEHKGDYTTGIEALSGGVASSVVLTSGTLGFPTFASLGRGEFEDGSPREVLREFWMNGMRPGMRVMCLYPAWHHLSLLDNRALEWMGAHCLIPWGTFTPGFAQRALELIESQAPEYLLTTTTMLHAMVEEALKRGKELHEAFASVRFAMVAGEPVSPAQRRLIKRQLGLKDLFERGGSSDGLWGGADCSAHAGHHVWLDHHYIEVIDPVSGEALDPGRRGSVVVTNLTLDRSLYIRFDTEDLGEVLPGTCPCGRTHQRVELYGRLADCVWVNGRLIAPYDVRVLLDEIPDLVGVPLVLGRYADDMPLLRVYLDGDARESGLAEAATRHLAGNMGLPVEVGWTNPLPKRWKARMVIDSSPIGLAGWPRR